MIRVSTKMAFLVLGALTVPPSWAQAAATGTAFTYQGRLTHNGAPANGTFDLQFKLFDGPAGNAQLIGTTAVADMSVVDGLFTANLDFGLAAFDGGARWLEVAVLDPWTFQYLPLSPRQYLAATPYATHALSSAQWKSVGTNITNANPGFVGVNRSSPVNANEFFGVQVPKESGYGGMFLRTDGSEGKPFYAYGAGTAEYAWTYLDGPTGDWRVYNEGDRLTITDQGDVGIGVTAPASLLHVKQTDATGDAARIEVTNAANGSSAIWARNYGMGRVAFFETENNNNPWPTLEVQNGGTGPAAKFVGEVEMHGEVTVDGHLMARFGSSDFARATPIAFGTFEPYIDTPVFLTSSGNVSITYVNGQGFRIQVQGEGDPQNWTVVTSITYDNPTGNVFHVAKAGTPLSVAGQPGTGVVYLSSQCVGCDEFISGYQINFAIYKGN